MRWLAIFSMVIACGCGTPGTFACANDLQCDTGRCEPTGACSFVDSSCASGRRYDHYAGGGFADVCVGEETPDDAAVLDAEPDGMTDALPDDGAMIATVYATTATALYRVNPSSGAGNLIGTFTCTSGPVADIALTQTGDMYIVVGTTLYSVNPVDATCALIGVITPALPAAVGALAFIRTNGADALRAATGATPGKLYVIDEANATDVEIGQHGGGYFARGDLTWITGDGIYETVTDTSNGDWLAKIDATTGAATGLVATARAYTGLVALGADLYGFGSDGKVAKLDKTTGADISSNDGGQTWTGAAAPPLPL